jgi:uncharacterized membrane protein YphA (DoxX/SURF4 family)
MRTWKAIGLKTLQVLIGLMLVLAGTGKFRGQFWAGKFAQWGYPGGFYMVVGVFEVAAGVAIWIPKLATYGALLAMIIMCAAALTGLTHGEMRFVGAPIFYFGACAIVAWLRRGDRWR